MLQRVTVGMVFSDAPYSVPESRDCSKKSVHHLGPQNINEKICVKYSKDFSSAKFYVVHGFAQA